MQTDLSKRLYPAYAEEKRQKGTLRKCDLNTNNDRMPSQLIKIRIYELIKLNKI